LIFNKVLWDVESILISTNIALFWYVYVSLLLQNFAVLWGFFGRGIILPICSIKAWNINDATCTNSHSIAFSRGLHLQQCMSTCTVSQWFILVSFWPLEKNSQIDTSKKMSPQNFSLFTTDKIQMMPLLPILHQVLSSIYYWDWRI